MGMHAENQPPADARPFPRMPRPLAEPVHQQPIMPPLLNGKLKIRILALMLVVPWTLHWTYDLVPRFCLLFGLLVLVIAPWLAWRLNILAYTWVFDAVAAGALGFAEGYRPGGLCALVVILAAQPDDALYLLPTTTVARLVGAPIFCLLALLGSTYRRIPWYQVGFYGLKGGVMVGEEAVQAIYRGTLDEWLTLTRSRLGKIVRQT